LEAVPGGERIITDAPPTSRTMFYGPGVDAVRRRDLRSAERCWSAFQVKHGKQVYRAPQCDVLAPRACVTDADHWKVYEPDADRASGRWVTPFPLAAKMIPAMLDDVQGHYWLSICDITQDRAPGLYKAGLAALLDRVPWAALSGQAVVRRSYEAGESILGGMTFERRCKARAVPEPSWPTARGQESVRCSGIRGSGDCLGGIRD